MNKLTMEFQRQFAMNLIFAPSVLEGIDTAVKLHTETRQNPLSSSAACLNVLGPLANDPHGLAQFLRCFGLDVDELYEFPSPVSFGDRLYHDRGYVVFEWVGPRRSPINERGGGRGYGRTSLDAFVLGRIGGKTTQILIEWKFTEGLSRPLTMGRFCGGKGVERLSRYSSVLARMRRQGRFPFDFDDEYSLSGSRGSLGLHDFSPDHLYQLLRMTLLAKMTVGEALGPYTIEDYRILHLTHSQNDEVNVLQPKYLTLSPGLQEYSGQPLHDVWRGILSVEDRQKFCAGHWDQAIGWIKDEELRTYLVARYG